MIEDPLPEENEKGEDDSMSFRACVAIPKDEMSGLMVSLRVE